MGCWSRWTGEHVQAVGGNMGQGGQRYGLSGCGRVHMYSTGVDRFRVCGGQDYGRGCGQVHGLCEPEYDPGRTVALPWLDGNVVWDTQKYSMICGGGWYGPGRTEAQ